MTEAPDLCGISQASADLIINEETGGQHYYTSSGESHPEWPGGMSGVTIGNGYDCGYSTRAQIAADWSDLLAANAVNALQDVAGIHGSPAQSHAHELHWITVSWDAAMVVFYKRDLPKWVAICRDHLPNFDRLPPDCKGVIASLTFNRGPSYDKDGARYIEMRNIKTHMQAMEFDKIPQEFLAMRRLWPKGGDLWRRREHEALLFDQGLANAQPGAANAEA